MPDHIAENSDHIDTATGRLICQAIGERLRTDAPPDDANLPPRLQSLLDEFQARDGNS